MKLMNLVEGLQILAPFYEGGDGYHIGAEHDTFFAYSTDKPLPSAAVERLVELGWFQEDAVYEDEFKAENYNAEEGWTAYV
jgi:hypothetical protein